MTKAEIEQEALATFREYVKTRDAINRGELPWTALDQYFTEDAAFSDPAWGRVEGRENIREFFAESMAGLEDWTFPEIWTQADGHGVVTLWMQRMGEREDGSPVECPGISVLYYAGDGKFCFEMDLLNMKHVGELMRETRWRPSGDFNMPPKQPDRDISLPKAWAHLASDATYT